MHAPRPSQLPEDDLYELLQVSPRADIDVIEAAYRVLARRYHPDVNQAQDATATMARLNVAWETLREPDSRAAYDQMHNGRTQFPLSTGPAGWAADVAAERQQTAAGPILTIEPAALNGGRLRQGAGRSFALSVQTEPPGIRVTAAVPLGETWLTVAPTLLKGIEKEEVVVDLHTRGLRPGRHRGAIEFSTSWETRAVPVDVQVVRASAAYRLRGMVGLAATNTLLLATLLLVALLGALLAIALR